MKFKKFLKKAVGIALAPVTGGASLIPANIINKETFIKATATGLAIAGTAFGVPPNIIGSVGGLITPKPVSPASGNVVDPNSIQEGQPVSTAPIVGYYPSPLPLPLPNTQPVSYPVQKQSNTTTPLLLGGFGLVAVILLTRK